MLWVYKTWPQDGFWGWTMEEFVARTVCVYRPGFMPPEVSDDLLQQFKEAWALGHDMARQLGWEGDVREGYPMISLLPREGMAVFLVIVWKQDNNGTTFVVSERPLPWLEEQGGTWLVEKGSQ